MLRYTLQIPSEPSPERLYDFTSRIQAVSRGIWGRHGLTEPSRGT